MKKLTAIAITLTAIGVAVKVDRRQKLKRNLKLWSSASESLLKTKPSVNFLEP